MRVLGISGSLRASSHNTLLLHAARRLAPDAVELEVYEGLRELPLYDQDAEIEPPAAVRDLRARIAAAEAVLIATPEYNSSLPGGLKNALDWASRPYATNSLRNKPVAVIGASTNDYGAMWARADTRRVLGRIGARVLEDEFGLPNAQDAFGDDGLPAGGEAREQLTALLEQLAEAALPAPARTAA